MEKKLLKYLTSASLVAISLAFTACDAMKPDHPQVKESFKERRSPRDNTLAASGALGEKKTEAKASNFQPIVPTSVVNNTSGSVKNAIAQSSIAQSITGNNPQTSAEADLDNGSFFQRFFDKLTSPFKTSSVDSSKRMPRASTLAMNVSDTEIEQGSRMGATYYDMADDMLPAHPVHSVAIKEMPSISSPKNLIKSAEFGNLSSSRIQLAQAAPAVAPVPAPVAVPVPPAPTAPVAVPAPVVESVPAVVPTPVVDEKKVAPQAPEMPATSTPNVTAPVAPQVSSAPLTAVPVTPSMDEMKAKVETSTAPELKDTPKVPEQFNSAPVAQEAPAVAEETKPVVAAETEKKPEVAPVKKAKKPKRVVKMPKIESRDPLTKHPEHQDVYNVKGKKVATDFLDKAPVANQDQ